MVVQTLSPAKLFIFLWYVRYYSEGFSIIRNPNRQQATVSLEWTDYNNHHFAPIHQPPQKHSYRIRQTILARRAYAKSRSLNENDASVENQSKESDVAFRQTMSRSVNLDQYDVRQQLFLTIGSSVLQVVLQSPIWKYVLVPMARQKIIDTAQANGIAWNECKDWLLSQSGPWNNMTESHRLQLRQQLDIVPMWYQTASYHAYEKGHLSYMAAVELELASAAIGARNIPEAGINGEAMFRSAFTTALIEAGSFRTLLPLTTGSASNDEFSSTSRTIIDIGCGTGTSTRRLGQLFPQPDNLQITGIDLSPYFIQTGIRLHELLHTNSAVKIGNDDDNSSSGSPWVCTIESDRRIQYLHGDGTNLRNHYEYGTVDIVNVQFVFHELPIDVACSIIQEAHRLLKPNGGQLWICEMDFESPAYKAQRNNPFLFSLVRATEPYLDEYATGQSTIWLCLHDTFDTVTITAATGRHYALVATKMENIAATGTKSQQPRWTDLRFSESGQYRVNDTHLQVWENKSQASTVRTRR